MARTRYQHTLLRCRLAYDNVSYEGEGGFKGTETNRTSDRLKSKDEGGRMKDEVKSAELQDFCLPPFAFLLEVLAPQRG
jgi:hypothetical protein